MSKISVILIDDHAVVRAGLRLLLSQYDGIAVLAEAERGEESLQCILQANPDVVIMDINLPGMGGLAAIRRICARKTRAKILAFSVHDEPLYVTRALEAGAKGYVSKSSAPEVLVKAIFKVAAGIPYIDPEIAQHIAIQTVCGDAPSELLGILSPREFDVFRLLVDGSTTREIAERLCVSYKTVVNCITLIKKKLRVNTAADMTRLAYKLGISKTE